MNECVFSPEAEAGSPLGSLKSVVMPVDPQLNPGGDIVRNQTALVQLGKALFWDQQVGSDGQACGTCHFSAGADARTINQISPGLKSFPTADTTFQLGPPNDHLQTSDFPIHKLSNPDVHGSRVLRDANDVVSSAGVFRRDFSAIQGNTGGLDAPRPAFDMRAFDVCSSVLDDSTQAGFNIRGVNVRRVEPRNTPTMINAMFSNRNFWDSRAQDVFNGDDPFGARDTAAFVWKNSGGSTTQATKTTLAVTFSSLASQAVGPPLSLFEMSCQNRTFPDLGHKLLTSTNTPLAQQLVDSNDSVLGGISNARNTTTTDKGLSVSYGELVRRAFQPRWWNSNVLVDTSGTSNAAGRRPQIEANFSMFWGLSVQAYMETLRADDTPVDRFFDRRANLTASQLRGLNLFQSAIGPDETFGHSPDPFNPTTRVPSPVLASGKNADLRCTACHGGPETTAARIDAIRNDARLERMAMPNGGCQIYDGGHFNTGVRRTSDDLALGAADGTLQANPLAETQLAINGTLLALVPTANLGTSGPTYGLQPSLAIGTTNCDAANIKGTFKAPQLRNVELTGPYFHNGGQLTLRQVVDFYNRGGDFDNAEFDPNVHSLGMGTQDRADLVNFLLALTDERVAFERAPFDHPSLCFANGEQTDRFGNLVIGPDLPGPSNGVHQAADNVQCVNAVGAGGRRSRLTPFLGANPQDPTP